MECLHYTCFNCFKQFINNTCPFCRREIQLYTSSFHRENEEPEDIIFENDFIIPIIRKDRHDKKRKKIEKQKQILNSLIENQKKFYNIPNIKSRFNKKLKNIKKILKKY